MTKGKNTAKKILYRPSQTRTHHIKILIQYSVAGEIIIPMLLQSPDKEPSVIRWSLFKVFSHSQANAWQKLLFSAKLLFNYLLQWTNVKQYSQVQLLQVLCIAVNKGSGSIQACWDEKCIVRLYNLPLMLRSVWQTSRLFKRQRLGCPVIIYSLMQTRQRLFYLGLKNTSSNHASLDDMALALSTTLRNLGSHL